MDEVGIMADSYREWKLLERCIESTAIRYDLSISDALVLLALGRDGFSGKKANLADLAHISKSVLSRSLSQLEARGMIETQRNGITVLTKAIDSLEALEHTIQDWKEIRFGGFTEEEVKMYKELHKRIQKNISFALK